MKILSRRHEFRNSVYGNRSTRQYLFMSIIDRVAASEKWRLRKSGLNDGLDSLSYRIYVIY